ncbi:hypothetical protein NM688_g4780 [Phlebia brevispora]|uniref:Uncharacterized protein n=1 Tax=Phlebia brevispora TaxID=194682 RepID=A0ACC1T242_9APHY|nr:hypothetical protein NM688_g4780 [Phlebia brevispora]
MERCTKRNNYEPTDLSEPSFADETVLIVIKLGMLPEVNLNVAEVNEVLPEAEEGTEDQSLLEVFEKSSETACWPPVLFSS